ncbi:unnamed protein product [Musa hybrid cultivar]
MRAWERGAAMRNTTLACGTGARVVLVAAVLEGYTERVCLTLSSLC